MRTFAAILGLCCASVGALAAGVTIGSPTTVTASSTAVVNERPAYDFYWDMESDTPVFGVQPPVSQTTATYYSSAARSTTVAHSGSGSLYIPAVVWPAAYWYNNTNARVWASPSRGEIECWFLYPSTYVAAALLWQVNAKSQNGALDTNDGTALRTALVGGGSTPGFLIGATSIAMRETATAGAWYRLVYRYDRDPAAVSRRKNSLYVFEPGGTVTIGYETGSQATAAAAEWHHVLPGNDTSNAMAYYLDDFVIRPSYQYDLPSQVHQDFEIASLDASSLATSDNDPNRTWVLTGTTSRFSIATAAQITNPGTINLAADTGTRGLRNDMSATASANIGTTTTLNSSPGVVSFWVRVPSFASGTSAEIAFVGSSATSRILGVNWKNVSGQHQFTISGAAESSAVLCSPGTYWLTLYVIRNGTARLQVYDTTGAQVGSEINASATNFNFAHVGLGSASSNTAQAAGTYVDYDHLLFESANLYPILPWYRP